jgi:transcriptional regulator of arginine metabolism
MGAGPPGVSAYIPPETVHAGPTGTLVSKRDRHAVILDLIDARAVASQEELRRLLRQRGWDVTQSTLSRDVHELRLVRLPTTEGVRYARAGSAGGAEEDAPTLDALLPQLLTSVDGVGELLVLRTPPGSAHTVAIALDSHPPSGVLGTVAGDDTILVICRSTAARERLGRRVRTLARRSPGV